MIIIVLRQINYHLTGYRKFYKPDAFKWRLIGTETVRFRKSLSPDWITSSLRINLRKNLFKKLLNCRFALVETAKWKPILNVKCNWPNRPNEFGLRNWFNLFQHPKYYFPIGLFATEYKPSLKKSIFKSNDDLVNRIDYKWARTKSFTVMLNVIGKLEFAFRFDLAFRNQPLKWPVCRLVRLIRLASNYLINLN